MYDYARALDAQAKRDSRLWTDTTKLTSAQAWQLNAYGSASCSGGSWQSALDAYAEYRAECNY